MTTITAQILVGKIPGLREQFRPSHALYFIEGDAEEDDLAWIRLPTGLVEIPASRRNHKLVWKTSKATIVDDGLLMAGLCVEQHSELVTCARSYSLDLSAPEVDLNTALQPDQLRELHELNRKVEHETHLKLTTFYDCGWMDESGRLKDYHLEMEFCSWCYVKLAPGLVEHDMEFERGFTTIRLPGRTNHA
jgi:hypothetical protein